MQATGGGLPSSQPTNSWEGRLFTVEIRRNDLKRSILPVNANDKNRVWKPDHKPNFYNGLTCGITSRSKCVRPGFFLEAGGGFSDRTFETFFVRARRQTMTMMSLRT